jgi:hypothetical protein
MLTARYMSSTKNLPKIMDAVVKGTAPAKFSVEHLQGLGFKSSNDRAIIPLLKDLKFLSEDGTPTQRYHQYRGHPRPVMGEALREAYEELFHVNAKPSDADRAAIIGKFKTAHGVSDRVAECQAVTFLALLKMADLDAKPPLIPTIPDLSEVKMPPLDLDKAKKTKPEATTLSLRYNIEVHLPATKDIEVFRAIFKALREHLAD